MPTVFLNALLNGSSTLLWIAWWLGEGTFLHHKIAACHKMLHGFRRTQNMWNNLSRDVSGAWSGLLKTVASID